MNLTAEIMELRRRQQERPLPQVDVDSAAAFPGWCFRVLAPLATGGLVALAGLHVDLLPELVLAVAGAFAVWVAIKPSAAPAHVAVLLSALVLFGAPVDRFDPFVLLLAPVALVTVRLTWWAEHVGRRARVEAAALARTARRDAVVIAVTLGVGGVGWFAAGFAVVGLVVVGAIALLTLSFVLLGAWRS